MANYGQMTAGGWMYIGPQGIVHGTFNTILNAGRMKLGVPEDGDLRGHLFVSSGLGGMSGAQPKAADIAGAVSIVAEVDDSRIETRRSQGWVKAVTSDLEEAFSLADEALARKEPLSIAYHGNIVDLLEYAVDNNKKIELLSDQTSCHAVYEGDIVRQDSLSKSVPVFYTTIRRNSAAWWTRRSTAISRRSRLSWAAAHISSTMATRS